MHAHHHEAQAMADINITPLVDVMLVLLVIFMITLPMITDTTPLSLAESAPPPEQAPPRPMRLHLSATGALHWNGNEVSEELLRAELRALSVLSESTRPALLIDADPELRYETVLQWLARIHDLGIRQVRLQEHQARSREVMRRYALTV